MSSERSAEKTPLPTIRQAFSAVHVVSKESKLLVLRVQQENKILHDLKMSKTLLASQTVFIQSTGI
jgi:hypothetical protein